MTLVAAYGLTASCLLIGAALSRLPWRHGRLLGIAAALASSLTLGPWLHGILGAPSFTLFLWAALTLAVPSRPALPGGRAALALALALGAIIFYPLALGVGPFDPYALGYQPLPLLGALAALGAVLAWRRQGLWLVVLGADLAAYAAGLFPNLWGALFDPLLVLLAVTRLLRRPQCEIAAPIN